MFPRRAQSQLKRRKVRRAGQSARDCAILAGLPKGKMSKGKMLAKETRCG
jgi:hypothetical protein